MKLKEAVRKINSGSKQENEVCMELYSRKNHFLSKLRKKFPFSFSPEDGYDIFVKSVLLIIENGKKGKIRDMGDGKELDAYLWGVGCRLAKDTFRKEKQRKERHNSYLSFLSSNKDHILNFDSEKDDQDDNARIRKAIDELPDPGRKVVRMHYIERHDAKYIAEVTGLSENSIPVIRNRAINKLRVMFGVQKKS